MDAKMCSTKKEREKRKKRGGGGRTGEIKEIRKSEILGPVGLERSLKTSLGGVGKILLMNKGASGLGVSWGKRRDQMGGKRMGSKTSIQKKPNTGFIQEIRPSNLHPWGERKERKGMSCSTGESDKKRGRGKNGKGPKKTLTCFVFKPSKGGKGKGGMGREIRVVKTGGMVNFVSLRKKSEGKPLFLIDQKRKKGRQKKKKKKGKVKKNKKGHKLIFCKETNTTQCQGDAAPEIVGQKRVPKQEQWRKIGGVKEGGTHRWGHLKFGGRCECMIMRRVKEEEKKTENRK